MKSRNLRSTFIIIFCCWFTMLSVLSGCGQMVHSNEVAPSEGSNEEITDSNEVKKRVIAGWFKEDCTTNLMAFLAESFPEYEFEYRYISKRTYESLIDAQLPSRLAPDIVMVTQNMARKHGGKGYLVDLTQYCSGFEKEAREAFSYEDSIYAVPGTSEYQCVYYNRELLEKSGQKLPSDLAGVIEIGDYMTEDMNVKPMSAGLKDPDKVADSALTLLASGYFSAGEGKTFSQRLQNGEATFLREIRPNMTLWQNMHIHGFYTKEMCIMDEEAAIEEFASGKSFMYTGGLEDYNRIMEKNPDMKLGTIIFSVGGAHRPVLIGGCNCGFAVNSFGENIEEATEAVASLATEEGQRAFWRDRPGSQTYLENVVFQNPAEFDALRPIVDVNRSFMPWNEWGDHSTAIYHVFGEELQKVLSGKRSMQIAFEVIDDKVSIILGEE